MAKESKKIIQLRQQARELNLRSREERKPVKIKKKHKKKRGKIKKQYPKNEEYTQLLRSTLWQNKRKEILERDGNRCTECGKRKQLHVHHIKYIGKPWECPNEYLVTLCKICHENIHKELKVNRIKEYKSRR